MIVLKLGGSLLSSAEPSYLRQWLSLASEQGKGKLVIVPGGGVFADQVRLMQKQWHYNDQKHITWPCLPCSKWHYYYKAYVLT